MKAAWLAVPLLVIGCGASNPGTSTPGSGSGGSGSGGSESPDGAGGDGGSSGEAQGGFLVNLVALAPAANGLPEVPAHTTLGGKVVDGPSPALITWNDSASGNGCTLQVPKVPFCNPACGSGMACVGSGQCLGYPASVDLGIVTVKGLGSADITIKALNASYQYGGDLPDPPADEGAPIEVDAPGGKLGAFTIRSTGIVPLDFPGPVMMESGKAASLTWTAQGMPQLSRIQIKLDISHHGGTRGQILCDVPDTGTLEIPEPLITQLMALGVAGFPSITLSRVATGWASATAGRISLQVNSSAEQRVQIPGLLSCTETSQCPTGQTCQTDLRCK